MRWKGRRGSENVEDRRNLSPAAVGVGGGILGLLIVLVVTLLGGDPRRVMRALDNQNAGRGGNGQANAPVDPREKELADFVSVVLADTEDVWKELFAESGKQYPAPQLVLYRGQIQSACGFNSAATGPFYCPGDAKVYLDLTFFDDMEKKLGAVGDFAQAYVIAHEIGHHVQNVLGVSQQVAAMRQRMSEDEYNQLSVRVELQADYYAGVWANHAQKNWRVLEPGDIEEALNAASAIGDDRLQKNAQGYVVPESFTHGSSEQRVHWFSKGLQSGDPDEGDTFTAEDL